MKRLLVFVPLLAVFLSSCNHSGNSSRLPESVTMSKEVLLDKIKGGWAGQTIGCSYGGPTEFDLQGRHDYELHPASRGRTVISNGGTKLPRVCTTMCIWT